jgi:PAS fold
MLVKEDFNGAKGRKMNFKNFRIRRKMNMENNNGEKKGFEESTELALHYMDALVACARESFLVLDNHLKVILANPTFYEVFQVLPEKTENQFLYELGDKQWDIPELKKLIEEILPKKKVVKDFEVTHTFEKIGEKTMVLNAKQIDSVQLIILAIEDITQRKKLEDRLAQSMVNLSAKVDQRTAELNEKVKQLEVFNKSMIGRELKMVDLKKEIQNLGDQLAEKTGKNGKGKNGNGKK